MDNSNILDIELEMQLKKYIAAKKAKKIADKDMIDDFSETDEGSITVNQTSGFEALEIEEDDE